MRQSSCWVAVSVYKPRPHGFGVKMKKYPFPDPMPLPTLQWQPRALLRLTFQLTLVGGRTKSWAVSHPPAAGMSITHRQGWAGMISAQPGATVRVGCCVGGGDPHSLRPLQTPDALEFRLRENFAWSASYAVNTIFQQRLYTWNKNALCWKQASSGRRVSPAPLYHIFLICNPGVFSLIT